MTQKKFNRRMKILKSLAIFSLIMIALTCTTALGLAAPERAYEPTGQEMEQIERENPEYVKNRNNKAPFVGDEKTNIGLVNYAYKALNEEWNYVYGGKGQYMTSGLVKNIVNSTGGPYSSSRYRSKTLQQVGHRATDCSGLVMSYFWWAGDDVNPIRELNSDIGRYNADNMLRTATVKGTIDTLPETPGILVHKKGHVGVYIGNGQVIEAKDVGYGVVLTKLNETKWTHWSKSPWIDYEVNGIYQINGENKIVKNGNVEKNFSPEEFMVFLNGLNPDN